MKKHKVLNSFISLLFSIAIILFSHSFVYAGRRDKPSDPKCKPCENNTCPIRGIGSGFLSLSEGSFTDSYDVVTVRSSFGSTLDLNLFYDTSMADGYKVALYTCMGFGWTHSYNIYLTEYRFDLYLTGGAGRTTKFKIQPDRKTYKPIRGDYQQLVKNPDGTLTMTLKDGTKYDFKRFIPSPFPLVSPPYLVTKITDRNGNETLFTYDSTGLLQEVQDTYGRSITFTYDSNRRISTIKDPLNRITTLTYDNSGYHLTKITDPDGNSVEYTYNSNHQTTSKKDKNGRLFTYTYNGSGRPIAIQDGNGDVILSLSNDKNWSYNRIKDIFYKERYIDVKGTVPLTLLPYLIYCFFCLSDVKGTVLFQENKDSLLGNIVIFSTTGEGKLGLDLTLILKKMLIRKASSWDLLFPTMAES
jgi:YD repeat-containing protein